MTAATSTAAAASSGPAIAASNLPPVMASNLEKLLKMDDDLQLLQQKRKELDRSVAHLEAQLYNTERRYLETTVNGNVSVGFAGFYPNNSQSQHTVNNYVSNATSGNGYGGSMYTTPDDDDDMFDIDQQPSQQVRPKTISLANNHQQQIPLFSSSSAVGQESQTMILSYSSNTLRKSLQTVNDEVENGGYHTASGSSGHHKSSGGQGRRKKSIVKLSLVSQ